MANQNCELLLAYIKSFLYGDGDCRLEPDEWEEPCRSLATELMTLRRNVEELLQYTKALSCGNLSVPFPQKDNYLCANLKELHTNLNHLVWQANQVVEGDYSHHISSFGELSDAFNCMTAQLQERREILQEEVESAHRRVDAAYYDPGTRVRNRLYFEEYMREVLGQQQDITLCYMDLDGLKYVNDHFGHNEGDCYIRRFVQEINSSFRTTDVFARIGGDEFCIVLLGRLSGLMEKKMADTLEHFQTLEVGDYAHSFSYGIVEIDGGSGRMSLEEVLHRADEKMYECKRKNKERLGCL